MIGNQAESSEESYSLLMLKHTKDVPSGEHHCELNVKMHILRTIMFDNNFILTLSLNAPILVIASQYLPIHSMLV